MIATLFLLASTGRSLCPPVLAQTYAFNRADFAVGVNPVGGATADFNGDRKRDLAVLNFDDGTVSILLANGDGTFKPRIDVPVGVNANFVTARDMNADHKPDLVVTNGAANTVSIFLGNGDGTFQPGVSFTTGSYPVWADVGDFNADGKPDVVVANYSGDSVSILLGNGDGTLQPHNDLRMAPTPDSVVAGDFNGDGRLDVAVANATGSLVGIITVALGNGDGTLRIGKKSAVGPLPESIAAGDFNRDGKLDLVVANLQTGVNTVSLILGNGDGTFQSDQQFATANTPYRLAISDFNRDGKPDVAVATAASLGSFVSVLLGNGDGTLQARTDYATGANSDWVMPIDANGDEYPDLAVVYTDCVFGICSGPGTGAVTILVGDGHGTFSPRQDFPTDLDPSQVVLADLNRDGRLDVITANENSDTVSVLLGEGDGQFESHVETPTGKGPVAVAVADFNSDENLDLAVADFSSNTVSVFLGKGDGTFNSRVDLLAGQSPQAILSGDFNGDGKDDLVIGNAGANSVSILIGLGNGRFKHPQDFAVAGAVTSLAAADFNRDGKMDLVVCTSTSNLSVLLGNGDGTFQPHIDLSTGGINLALTVADFDGDGRPDIAAAAYSDRGFGYNSVLLGNGDGSFQPHKDGYPTPFVPLSISAGDFDADGKPDLITANYGTAAIVLGNGSGTFSHYVIFATGDGSTSVAVGDVNGDGAPDFVSANTSSMPFNGISVFLNTPVVALSPPRIYFPPQLVGTSSAGRTISVSNPSIAPLLVSDIHTLGDFTETNTCGTSLLGGGNCSVTISFSPSQRGVARGSTMLTTNGLGGTQTVQLVGTGTVVEILPRSLDFGPHLVGVKSHVRQMTLRNSGDMTLHISGISITGVNAADFLETNDCGRGLRGGDSCTLRVTFKPSAKGLRTASLDISDDGGASPQTPALSGTGQ